MKYIFRTLASNLHILVISLLVAGLSLGLFAVPQGSKSTATGVTSHQKSFDLSSGPAAPGTNEPSNTNSSGTVSPFQGSLEPQTAPEPNTSNSQTDALPDRNATNPVTVVSPSTTCTPSDCTPEFPTPVTPAGDCGICGTVPKGGLKTEHIMCPMYCTQSHVN